MNRVRASASVGAWLEFVNRRSNEFDRLKLPFSLTSKSVATEISNGPALSFRFRYMFDVQLSLTERQPVFVPEGLRVSLRGTVGEKRKCRPRGDEGERDEKMCRVSLVHSGSAHRKAKRGEDLIGFSSWKDVWILFAWQAKVQHGPVPAGSRACWESRSESAFYFPHSADQIRNTLAVLRPIGSIC